MGSSSTIIYSCSLDNCIKIKINSTVAYDFPSGVRMFCSHSYDMKYMPLAGTSVTEFNKILTLN
jgi:hypothetical protein